jgi:hypothetical protein
MSAGSPVQAESGLVVRVLPIIGRAPTDIVVQAFIDRDARNRTVTFIVDSEEFYGSSTYDLDGERAPRTKEVRFKRLPAGFYLVRVVLSGPDGERARADINVPVL